MWHAVVLVLGLLSSPTSAQASSYFSEGGGSVPQQPRENKIQGSLENIVDELKLLREAQLRAQEEQLYDEEIPVQFGDVDRGFVQNEEVEQPQAVQTENGDRFRIDFQQPVASQEAGQQEEQQVQDNVPKVPLTAQKKGQFEFVEFVEPHAKALKNVEFLDKRAAVTHVERPGGLFNLFGSSSNVVFIALVTMCCVASVVGVVGGAYYFNTVRKQRAEAFDDFTRYSPAGPGRDMLRKGRGFAGSPVAETGDESLAYKAQLHHYQQTKQKIIGDEGLQQNEDQSDKSDDEADDLEEHNFSVYECPGLAPTGDIEVQNPNFSHNP